MERACFFIDGSNWYHGCRALGLRNLAQMNFARLSGRLVQHREWVATRYHVGRVASQGEPKLALAQQRFFSRLLGQDRRISLHLGRLERRHLTSPAATELKQLLRSLPPEVDPLLARQLLDLAERAAQYTVMVEKAVDVQIAIDMVIMAERQEFDVAYLLTADSDLAPAVAFVRSIGPRVYVVSPLNPGQLGAAATTFIRLRRPWFDGLFDPPQPTEP